MPRLTVVYGLVDENDGKFSISFPDAPLATGRGRTRADAINAGETILRAWVEGERRAGRSFDPRSSQELSYDHSVRLALQLGMDLVAVAL